MANLIINPDFEVNINNWSARNAATISRDTSAPLAGVGSALVVTPGTVAGEGIANDLIGSGLVASTAYNLALKVKGTSGVTLKIQLDEYTSATVYIDSDITTKVLDGTLQTVSFNFTSRSTAAKIRLFILTNTISVVTFRIDDVVLDLPSAPPAPSPVATRRLLGVGA